MDVGAERGCQIDDDDDNAEDGPDPDILLVAFCYVLAIVQDINLEEEGNNTSISCLVGAWSKTSSVVTRRTSSSS